MCEILIDDSFSLLNAHLPDTSMGILGSDSGFTLGNSEATHEVVDSLLRGDQIVRTTEGTTRQQIIPIKIRGKTRAGRAALAAKVHLALRRPKKITVIPCDGWGVPAWWRIQSADMDFVSNDTRAMVAGEQLYTVTLNVDAWAKSTTKHTVTGSNAIEPFDLYTHAIDGATGWYAENGTLDAGVGYVGVNSDGSSTTRDTLKNAEYEWDATGFNKITVECKANPSGGVDGSLYPMVGVLGLRAGAWSLVTAALVERTDLGTGWYAETLYLAEGASSAWDGLGVICNGGDPTDQDLKVRKVTLNAGSTFTDGMGSLFFDIPGSAPASPDITVSEVSGGLLLYTAPNLPEIIDGTAEGTYHLLADMTGVADVTVIEWTAGYQTGRINIADLPYDGNEGWITIAIDVTLPPSPGGSMTVTVIGDPDGTPVTIDALALWMTGPFTDYAGAYTIVEAAGEAQFKVVAPTPERPVPSYLIGGVQDNTLLRAVTRRGHPLDPGVVRIFAAWSGGAAPAGATVTVELHPAFHTEVPPPDRWFE